MPVEVKERKYHCMKIIDAESLIIAGGVNRRTGELEKRVFMYNRGVEQDSKLASKIHVS